jgi:REP element-mobilizing transposase RayT
LALQRVVAGIGDPGREAGWVTKFSLAGITDAGYRCANPEASASAGTSLDRLADLFHHHLDLQTTSDSGVKRSCSNTGRRVENAHDRHGWAIGRYVVMPDHVHFFCSAELDAKMLPTFMQAWKQWTSKRMTRELTLSGTVWQEEFFDHVLRSSESYSQKWDYVKENPVRADLVKKSDEWPWQGEVESLML